MSNLFFILIFVPTMKTRISHIFFSYSLLLSILLPISISFAHSLHKHNHNFCTATDEQHIHNEHINCSVFHYFSQTNYQKSTFNFVLFTPQYHSFKPVYFSLFFKSLNPNSFSIRGPPTLMFF